MTRSSARSVCLALVLAVLVLAAPAAEARKGRGGLAGPTNLRVAAMTPHQVTLAWDPAVNDGSFIYVIRADFGYQVGVPQTETSYTWTRDMSPGRTYSFVMWAGNAKGQESAKSNTLTVTLPVDRTPPAAPVVSVTGTTSSTVDLAWNPVADDDHTCCTYRVFANGNFANLRWTGETSVTVLRLRGSTTYSFTVVAVDPSRNASEPSAPVTATTQPTTDTTAPTAPGGLQAFDIDGCETWLFWGDSVDDVDPPDAILYEVHVNGIFDGAQLDNARWITYGTESTNTFTVQAIDSAGNRSAISSVTLEGQFC